MTTPQRYAGWKRVDWRKQDGVIAQTMEIPGDRVRQVRKMLGAPPPANPYRHRVTNARLATVEARRAELKGLNLKNAARLLGFKNSPSPAVLQMLKDSHLVVDGRRKHPWSKMNFELPNMTLERIWKLPEQKAAHYRYLNRLGKPRWNLRGGPSRNRNWPGDNPKYRQAVRAEERKAKKHHIG